MDKVHVHEKLGKLLSLTKQIQLPDIVKFNMYCLIVINRVKN